MKYIEWENLELMVDLRFKGVKCYKIKPGHIFYIEPSFYAGLMKVKDIYPNEYESVIECMNEISKKNAVTVYAGDTDSSFVDLENAIYLSVEDIVNKLKLGIDDKSRGSDYGD